MAVRGIGNMISQLSTVARTGNYGDLNNQPTMPPMVQRIRVQTNASGIYTWTFPTPYASGVIPIVMVNVEDSAANTIYQQKITAISNTSVTIQTTKAVPVTVLGVSVLGVDLNPQCWIHLAAVAP